MKRRTLTLDKRTGKYYALIQVDGVRKKFYFGKNRRQAEQELRKLESEVAEGATFVPRLRLGQKACLWQAAHSIINMFVRNNMLFLPFCEGPKSIAAIANPRVDRAMPSDITIEELITRYLEWVLGNRAKSTYENKKILLQIPRS